MSYYPEKYRLVEDIELGFNWKHGWIPLTAEARKIAEARKKAGLPKGGTMPKGSSAHTGNLHADIAKSGKVTHAENNGPFDSHTVDIQHNGKSHLFTQNAEKPGSPWVHNSGPGSRGQAVTDPGLKQKLNQAHPQRVAQQALAAKIKARHMGAQHDVIAKHGKVTRTEKHTDFDYRTVDIQHKGQSHYFRQDEGKVGAPWVHASGGVEHVVTHPGLISKLDKAHGRTSASGPIPSNIARAAAELRHGR